MWAEMFFSIQVVLAISFAYYHYNRDQKALGCVGVACKLGCAVWMCKAYKAGVVRWPVGCVGGIDAMVALLFAIDLHTEYLFGPMPRKTRTR